MYQQTKALNWSTVKRTVAKREKEDDDDNGEDEYDNEVQEIVEDPIAADKENVVLPQSAKEPLPCYVGRVARGWFWGI